MPSDPYRRGSHKALSWPGETLYSRDYLGLLAILAAQHLLPVPSGDTGRGSFRNKTSELNEGYP